MKTLLKVLLAMPILIGVASCHEVYFDRPQPIDAKDLPRFPSAIRVCAVDEDGDSAIFQTKGFDYFHTNKFSLEKSKLDSAGLYIKDGKLLSRTQPNLELSYEESDSTININELQISHYGLSDSVKLRKVAGNYILNIRIDTLWVLYLIEPTQRGINYRVLKESDLESLASVVQMSDLHDSKWFKGLMKKEDIQYLLDRGGFSDTVSVANQKKR